MQMCDRTSQNHRGYYHAMMCSGDLPQFYMMNISIQIRMRSLQRMEMMGTPIASCSFRQRAGRLDQRSNTNQARVRHLNTTERRLDARYVEDMSWESVFHDRQGKLYPKKVVTRLGEVSLHRWRTCISEELQLRTTCWYKNRHSANKEDKQDCWRNFDRSKPPCLTRLKLRCDCKASVALHEYDMFAIAHEELCIH